jgi:hypothetical protein
MKLGFRCARTIVFGLILGLGGAGTLRAQVPYGHWAVSAFHSGSGACPPGPSGVYVAHPRSTTACMTPIAGLPPALTQGTLPQAGANCILIHPSGDLLVGELDPGGGSVGVWRLPLMGLAVPPGAATYFPLGVAQPPANSIGQVAQMCLLNANTLILGCSFVASATVVSDPLQIFSLDLTSGAITQIAGVTGLGALNALTCDPATGNIFCGTRRRLTNGTDVSHIYELVLAGTPPTWSAPMLRVGPISGVQVTGLALDRAGSLLASFDATSTPRPPTLLSFARPTWLSTLLLTGWDVVNALAMEPSTDHVAFTGAQVRCQAGAPAGVHLLDRCTGAPPIWLTNCLITGTRGGISGIACAPNPRIYDVPSGPVSISWTTSCNGLPVAGATWSAATNHAGIPVSASLLFLGSAPLQPCLPLPGLGVNLCIVPYALAPLPMLPGTNGSSLTVPIPPLLGGAMLYAQSLHVTGIGLAATEGMCIQIL